LRIVLTALAVHLSLDSNYPAGDQLSISAILHEHFCNSPVLTWCNSLKSWVYLQYTRFDALSMQDEEIKD